MFTNMFGGDGQPIEEDGKNDYRKSKTTVKGDNKRTSIFTPVGAIIDGVRRSLSRSGSNNGRVKSQDQDEEGMTAGGDNKSNRKKRRSGSGGLDEDDLGEDSRVSNRSGGRSGGRQRRRDNNRGSKVSNGAMDFDDQETDKKKRREDYDK